MTEPNMPDDTRAPADGPTAGQLLRQAREAAGLHVVALAAMLKVPVRKLEALEAERFNELPDKTFVRTLALSVCRQLKVDAAPILALLPQSDQVRLGEMPSLNTPFRSPDSAPVPKVAAVSAVPRPVLFALGVLVLAAVIWFAVPARDPAAQVTTAVMSNGAVATTEPSPAADATTPPAQVAAAGSEPSVTTAPAEPGEGAATEPAATPAPSPSATVAAASTVSAAAAPATEGTLTIRASEASWVEVVGASGNLLLQRELGAGESVGFSTDAPYKVVVGRADATQVRVRGKALDISSYARNNVARFEVR